MGQESAAGVVRQWTIEHTIATQLHKLTNSCSSADEVREPLSLPLVEAGELQQFPEVDCTSSIRPGLLSSILARK